MHISNPITPRSAEILQKIMYAKWQIANIRERQKTAPAALYKVLNENLEYWLNRLAELQGERDGECTCNPINGTACPSCVESNKVRYPNIPFGGEL